MLTIPIMKRSAENVVWAYLSGILAPKGRSMAILSYNGTEFKNEVLNEVCDQLDLNRLLSNQFHPQVIAKDKNVHNFLKKSSPNSWTTTMISGMSSFHLLVIAITYFQAPMALYLHSSLCLDEIQQNDTYLTLPIAIGIVEPMKGK